MLSPEGGDLMNGFNALREGSQRSPSHHARAQGGVLAMSQEGALSSCQHFDFGLPSLQSCEQYIPAVYEAPGLWYFVKVA